MMGFFSKIFASANATGHTAVDDEEAARQAQIKKIEALLDSVNSASQHVRNYYITFLLACFYIAMIVWSTTDLMLLKNTPVTMPLLNVNLPITGFYTFAPYFFLLLHFNLLLQFSLLADKVHRFDQAVIELPDSDSRRYYYTRLFAFVFTQILSARHHSGLLRFLLTLMVWITAIWLPLGILIGLQVGFLPYHDENILSWQRIAVMFDLLVLLIFWPVIRAPDSRWRSWIKQACGLSWLLKIKAAIQPTPVSTEKTINRNSGYPVLEGSASLLTGFCVIVFVWGIAVLPDSEEEKTVAHLIPQSWLTAGPLSEYNEDGKRYFILTEYFFDRRYLIDKKGYQEIIRGLFHRNLILREKLLITNELKSEDEADLRSSDEAIREVALKKITGLILSERDLRYADFSKARLPNVDFVEDGNHPSDLRYTNFSQAMLVNARMSGTRLQGANLNRAQLQNAELQSAQLQKSYLSGANLEAANLSRANLREAFLQFADLRRANLERAESEGVILSSAKLQAAKLGGAIFDAASLSHAELHMADMRGVEIKGADLRGAWFLGTDLSAAKLQGTDLSAAMLQGANLSEAEFQGTDLSYANLQGTDLQGADFSMSDIRQIIFGLFSGDSFLEFREEIAQSVQDKSLQNRINNKFYNQARRHPNNSPKGIDVWSDLDKVDRIQLNVLKFARDKADYENRLAGYLIELSCQDRWIAQGITRHRINSSTVASDIAQCLLSLKDQRNQADQLICPAISEIDQATVELLQKAAVKKNFDATIIPTFSCRAERSDPLSAVD